MSEFFYPTGELIFLHRLRCSPFAVVYYSFMSYGLNLCERVGWVGLSS